MLMGSVPRLMLMRQAGLQRELVDLLQRDRQQISVFGDDAQSIYNFRGANPGAMKQFIQDYGISPEQVHKLVINYRSDTCACTPGRLSA